MAGWKEILRSQNKDRWNGTEERPEWGASPEKPSKPLRFDTRSRKSVSWIVCGVSCWFSPDTQYLSAKVCALAFECARCERVESVCAQTTKFLVVSHK